MTNWWRSLRDYSVIGNGLKGLAVGLLCNAYFFGHNHLDKLFEAIAILLRIPIDSASQDQIESLLSEASDLSTLGTDMVESGYLSVGILVLVSCVAVGLLDGLRERRVIELQNETERRARELEQAQEKLTQYQRSLAHSERLAALGRMAAGVSHEINNPLGAISGHIRLLAMQLPKDDKTQATLEVVQKEARRIREIIRGMNDFARHQPDPVEVRKTTCDLQVVLDEAIQAFLPRFAEAEVALYRDFNAERATVYGNKDQLRIVFNNLIANAIEATEGGGDLTLQSSTATVSHHDIMALKGHAAAAEEEGQTGERGELVGGETEFSMPLVVKEGDPVVRIDVIDSGQGISPDMVERIFEPFVTTKEVGYGLGLGLALTYSIIRNHGGYIDVSSKVDEGSRFTVVLAAAPDGPTESASPGLQPPPPIAS